MPLPNDVIVYPGHGQGSACGKNMSKETFDTLGNQKATNYALRADMTKEEFIKEVTTGLVAPPQYFPKNAVMNKMGYTSFDDVMSQGLNFLSIVDFKAEMQKKAPSSLIRAIIQSLQLDLFLNRYSLALTTISLLGWVC